LRNNYKDAGFPQEIKEGSFYLAGHRNVRYCWGGEDKPYGEYTLAPTLSELIEPCGDKFSDLKYYRTFKPEKRWDALNLELNKDTDEINTISSGLCSTPDEAVARLWLAPNKKSG